jgi:hypothetical protein
MKYFICGDQRTGVRSDLLPGLITRSLVDLCWPLLMSTTVNHYCRHRSWVGLDSERAAVFYWRESMGDGIYGSAVEAAG